MKTEEREEAMVSVTRGDREAAAKAAHDLEIEAWADGGGYFAQLLVQAFAEHRIAAIEATGVVELRAALFADDGSDASLNLQGALDDLQGMHKPNDGGVIGRTISRVIDQLERARTALASTSTDKDVAE